MLNQSRKRGTMSRGPKVTSCLLNSTIQDSVACPIFLAKPHCPSSVSKGLPPPKTPLLTLGFANAGCPLWSSLSAPRPQCFKGWREPIVCDCPNSAFPDAMLKARTQPWWKYLHYGNQHTLQTRAFIFVVKQLLTIYEHTTGQGQPWAGSRWVRWLRPA